MREQRLPNFKATGSIGSYIASVTGHLDNPKVKEELPVLHDLFIPRIFPKCKGACEAIGDPKEGDFYLDELYMGFDDKRTTEHYQSLLKNKRAVVSRSVFDPKAGLASSVRRKGYRTIHSVHDISMDSVKGLSLTLGKVLASNWDERPPRRLGIGSR